MSNNVGSLQQVATGRCRPLWERKFAWVIYENMQDKLPIKVKEPIYLITSIDELILHIKNINKQQEAEISHYGASFREQTPTRATNFIKGMPLEDPFWVPRTSGGQTSLR